MLEIKQLRLQAIGRFVDEQIIEFDKLGSLVQVDGIRNDTGGSSGSGKSTVFNSLDYLFGLNDIPSSVLQSRFTKESISVTMVGSFDGKPLTITRGKGKLSVDLDGEITTGSKLAEEKIDQILGMSRKLFRPLLHKRQKEGGFFLQFTPKEIHDFLTDALGLSEIRAKAELVEKKIKTITEEVTFNQGLLDQSKSALEATQSAAMALGTAPALEVDQSTVLALKKAYDVALEAIPPVKLKHTLELQSLDLTKPQMRSVSPDQSTLLALEDELIAIERKLEECVAKNAQDKMAERQRANLVQNSIQAKKVELAKFGYDIQNANSAKTEAARVAAEIKKIRDSICPTCDQNWATEAAKSRESELLGKLTQYRDLISKGIKSEQYIAQLSTDIDSLAPLAIEKPTPIGIDYTDLAIAKDSTNHKVRMERLRLKDTADAEHQVNRVLLEQFAVSQRALMERHSAELQQVSGQIDLTRRLFDGAVQKVKQYEEAKTVHERSRKVLAEQNAKLSNSVQEYQAKVQTLTDDLTMAEELKKAIKGYTSCSFDEALEYIGSAATEIIRAIPNMANATIQLEGIRETKEGKVKEEVNAVISMDGETGIPIKSLSGGERSSVDLAVDLAVIDLLEHRTNKGINIFILDEPFTGLDTVSIEMAIEKLKSLNKRLVIVDHNPEIKQMVESRLLVVRDGLISTIVQN